MSIPLSSASSNILSIERDSDDVDGEQCVIIMLTVPFDAAALVVMTLDRATVGRSRRRLSDEDDAMIECLEATQ